MSFARKAVKRREDRSLDEVIADEEAAVLAARKAELTPARIAEMERERVLSVEARNAAVQPLKPGTKVKVHITGWAYDPDPAEVVKDDIGPMHRTITAKRLRGGVLEEQATVRFENVSLWRD